MLSVHATLVQASLAAYQRFVHPLCRDDQERYYQEMALVARLFGTPASVISRMLADFRDYFAAQISGETIAGGVGSRAGLHGHCDAYGLKGVAHVPGAGVTSPFGSSPHLRQGAGDVRPG
jgi:hypothetical protein